MTDTHKASITHDLSISLPLFLFSGLSIQDKDKKSKKQKKKRKADLLDNCIESVFQSRIVMPFTWNQPETEIKEKESAFCAWEVDTSDAVPHLFKLLNSKCQHSHLQLK